MRTLAPSTNVCLPGLYTSSSRHLQTVILPCLQATGPRASPCPMCWPGTGPTCAAPSTRTRCCRPGWQACSTARPLSPSCSRTFGSSRRGWKGARPTPCRCSWTPSRTPAPTWAWSSPRCCSGGRTPRSASTTSSWAPALPAAPGR